jgi:hypothetical protein
VVIRFLLTDRPGTGTGKDELAEAALRIRAALTFLGRPTLAKGSKGSAEEPDDAVLILDALRNGIRFQSSVANTFLGLVKGLQGPVRVCLCVCVSFMCVCVCVCVCVWPTPSSA